MDRGIYGLGQAVCQAWGSSYLACCTSLVYQQTSVRFLNFRRLFVKKNTFILNKFKQAMSLANN